MNENKINKPTWIIHAIGDGDKIVYHTHGLDKYNSLELELNLSVPQHQAGQLLNFIGLSIANGKSYKDGDKISDIFNCDLFVKEVEGIYGNGERNLRIIIPDANLKYPWDNDCKSGYKEQI